MRQSPLPRTSLPGALLAAIVVMITVAGCGQTPSSAPQESLMRTAVNAGPWTIAPGPDAMGRLWPNDDGRFWRYHLEETTYPAPLQFYDNPALVPPAPSVWKIASRLRSETRGSDGSPAGSILESGTYLLSFRGNLTTESGATGQNLAETFFEDPLPGRARGTGETRALPGGGPAAFWSHLVAARPDLAAAVRTRLGSAGPATAQVIGGPILLHGGAFEKTAEHIGTYGDLNRDIAWLYLVADVNRNSTFDLQLVPDLASDVWLHALVLPQRYISRPKPAPDAVQVLYLIDYGVGEATTETGEPLGVFRSIEYGTVTYVPNVGPMTERSHAVFPSPVGDASGQAFDTRANLTATGLSIIPLARLP